MHWIEAHGFECLVAAFIFSGATSVMPPLPMGKGWWTTWFYNIAQLMGANLNNLVKHVPAGMQLEKLTQTTQEADGSRTQTEIATESVPKV